jgi:hypothetical protein
MSGQFWRVILLTCTLAAPAAAQESFVRVAVSPNTDPAAVAGDSAAIHDFHMLLRDRQRWGKPGPDVSGLGAVHRGGRGDAGALRRDLSGRQEILAWFQRMLGFGQIDNMRLTAGASGGMFYVTGRYRHMIHRADGRGRFMEDLGSYAWVWERQKDGRWRIQSMMMVPEPNPGSPANPYQ